MGVVTISRQYGAGGLRIGPAVAKALGFRFVDRELTEEAARKIGVDPRAVRDRDERAPGLIEELGIALASAPPLGVAAPPTTVRVVDDRALTDAVRVVLTAMADAGGYVILGRGGQAVLRDRADACHLALVADLEDRVHRISSSQGVAEHEARTRCEAIDRERAGYVRTYHGADLRDPLLYDAVLNTSRLGLDGATEVAVAAARRKLQVA